MLLRDSAAEIEQRGIEKGIEEGIEKGIEKGKLEIARNLLANGIPAEVIARSANLPLDQIEGLMH